MKPLLVDLETEWRGGQNQALLLLKGLRERGHRAELVAVEGSALAERAQELGVRVHTARSWLQRWRARRAVRYALEETQISVVHANEAHAATAVWLARAHRRAPVVISRRVGYPLSRSAFAQARYRAARRIIANSQWVAEQAVASGAARENVSVVHEGVEIPALPGPEVRRTARERWGIGGNEPLLGCVGVLLADKGQEWLIRALAALRAEFPDARLLLAGDGPCRPMLEQLTRELGLGEAVIFAGFVKDVQIVYAALDVFLLPSFFEALNNSLLAAMSYERPAVVFAKGALPEIIEHEKSGLLVSGPNVEEIRGAAARLLGDQGYARKLGQAARERVMERFSADRMVEGTLRVYEEVLREKKPAA